MHAKVRWYREVSFSDLLSSSGGYPRFDFYLPAYQIAIEYQGADYTGKNEGMARGIGSIFNRRDHSFSSSSLRKRVAEAETFKALNQK